MIASNLRLVNKTALSLFIIGLLVMSVLSIMGTVYLSQMAFANDSNNGKYCGVNETQRNIARFAIIVLWIQFAWIVTGSIIKPVWK